MLMPEESACLASLFRLRPLAAADARSVPAASVLEPQQCRAFLQQVMPVTGAPDLAIAASLLAKRLAFLASGNVLYAMSVFDKGIPLSLATSRLEYAHDDGLWTSSLPVDARVIHYRPGQREAWREQVVSALFCDFLAPLWRSMAQVSGLPIQILWENTAVRVYSLYQGRMEGLDPQQEQRQQADFNWLIAEADAALFGMEWNPLKRFRRPLQPGTCGDRVRFRRTCCYYYKATRPSEYCLNCPLCKPR